MCSTPGVLFGCSNTLIFAWPPTAHLLAVVDAEVGEMAAVGGEDLQTLVRHALALRDVRQAPLRGSGGD